jgi:hypothetical protein
LLLGKILLDFGVEGNAKKFEEICSIIKAELPDVEVKQINLDLPELQ